MRMQEAYLKERNADALMQQAQVAIACMPAGSEGDAGGKTEEEGSREMGRGIFALRDFKAGEVIMEESPLAFAPRDVLLILLYSYRQLLLPFDEVGDTCGLADGALQPMFATIARAGRTMSSLQQGTVLQQGMRRQGVGRASQASLRGRAGR